MCCANLMRVIRFVSFWIQLNHLSKVFANNFNQIVIVYLSLWGTNLFNATYVLHIHWSAACNYNRHISRCLREHNKCLEFEERLCTQHTLQYIQNMKHAICLSIQFSIVRLIHQVRGYTAFCAKWYRKFTAAFGFILIFLVFNLQAITVACLYLHHKYLHDTNHVSLLATVTFVGYTFILLILLIGKLLFIGWIFFHRLLLIVLVFTLLFRSAQFLLLKNCFTLSFFI